MILVQQQLSKELLLVINPKSDCWLGLQEFDGGGNELAQQIK